MTTNGDLYPPVDSIIKAIEIVVSVYIIVDINVSCFFCIQKYVIKQEISMIIDKTTWALIGQKNAIKLMLLKSGNFIQNE